MLRASASTLIRSSVICVILARTAAFAPAAPPRWQQQSQHQRSFRTNAVASSPLPLSRGRMLGGISMMSGGRSKISVEDVLSNPKWPEKWPFTPSDFQRMDESDDEVFYDSPRLVYHIDDGAINALTNYYDKEIKPGSDILDICSSWVSHFPKNFPETMGKRVGLGMNGAELKENKQLTGFVVQNLNKDYKLPFDDNEFDAVTCVVSVDYLVRPLEVFKEVQRVLRPGGKFIVSQSNRCFATKAISIWLNTNDLEHAFIIGNYFHFAGGYKAPKAVDISPGKQEFKIDGEGITLPSLFGGGGDPMFIIQAEKE